MQKVHLGAFYETYSQCVMLITKKKKRDDLPHILQWVERTLAVELYSGSCVVSKNPLRLGVLKFKEQIERGCTFIYALIDDSFRALYIMKTARAKQLKCCATLLQIFSWSISLCVDLLWLKISNKKIYSKLESWEYFNNREAWALS